MAGSANRGRVVVGCDHRIDPGANSSRMLKLCLAQPWRLPRGTMNLPDKVIAVGGVGGGIGRELVLAPVAPSAKVAALALSQERLREMADP